MLMMNEPVEKVSVWAKLCLMDSKLKRKIKQMPMVLFLKRFFIGCFLRGVELLIFIINDYSNIFIIKKCLSISDEEVV
jgi:hypothetical protein